MTRAIAFAVALSLSVVVRPAGAHHVVTEAGIAQVEPRNRAQLELSTATFELDSASGSWQSLAAWLEWMPLDGAALTLRAPLLRVDYDAGPLAGRTESGIGDVQLGAKARLIATEHGALLLSAGAALELPTGDADAGLGGGHGGIAPFVLAVSQLDEHWFVTGSLAAGFALSGDPRADHEPYVPDDLAGAQTRPLVATEAARGEVHGAVVAPHTSRELELRLRVVRRFGSVYGSLGADAVQPLVGDSTGPVAARAELGWTPDGTWRFALSGGRPLYGDHRYEWLGTLAALARF